MRKLKQINKGLLKRNMKIKLAELKSTTLLGITTPEEASKEASKIVKRLDKAAADTDDKLEELLCYFLPHRTPRITATHVRLEYRYSTDSVDVTRGGSRGKGGKIKYPNRFKGKL